MEWKFSYYTGICTILSQSKMKVSNYIIVKSLASYTGSNILYSLRLIDFHIHFVIVVAINY